MRAVILPPLRAFAEPIDVAAIELHAQRRILRAGLREDHRVNGLPKESLGGQQICTRHPHPAARPRDEPERNVAIPRNRREQQVRRELDVADL